MPLVGFGLWKVTNETCADTVYNAIKTGYRLFDGACDYGNEKEAGEGVARAIKDGLVKREELFIVSKLWNSFHDKERVGPICKKQLGDWGLEYFDLFIIHFPIALKYVDPSVRYPPGFFYENNKVELSKASLEETYHAMEELYEQGLIKSIGISNYTGTLVLDVERYAKHMPQTLQIEHHPYLVQQDLLDLCKSRGIAVTAYSSFGPQSFLELDMQKAKDTPLLMDQADVKAIADKHGKTPAQVLLRWATQRGVAVIPKSNNQNRLAANLDVCSFDLSEDEIKKVSNLDKGLRFNNPLNVSFPVAHHIHSEADKDCSTACQFRSSHRALHLQRRNGGKRRYHMYNARDKFVRKLGHSCFTIIILAGSVADEKRRRRNAQDLALRLEN